jgi:epsilon-lactone hydrolase
MTSGAPLPVSHPNLIAQTYMPASRQTVALERALRRTWIPVARNWRMTPRGLRMLQRVTEPGRRVPVLRGSVVEHLRVAGLPAEWVRGPRALGAAVHRDDRAVVLYLHGGGYVFGSPRTHRNLVSRISHVTGLPVLSLDYRLPPVATLPAPIEDALAAFRHLLEEGHAPERIVVVGDSAGGHLALTLALHAAEAGLPAPAALVLLSPGPTSP